MLLYAAMGEPAAALRQHQQLERIRKEEGEVGPSAATRSLARQIVSRASRLACSDPVCGKGMRSTSNRSGA